MPIDTLKTGKNIKKFGYPQLDNIAGGMTRPDPNLNTGTSRAQARVNQAVAMRSNADKVEDFQDEDQTYKNKLSKKSGWGRFFGAVVLGGTALLTGGTSLAIAAAAGVGSRLGNEAGEWHADKHDRPDELKEENVNYFKDDVKQINRDIEQFDADFDKNQWIDAGRDAWTAYNLANTAQAYGAKAATSTTEAVVNKTPLEGAKKMWGDSAEWGSNLFGKKTGDVASSDEVFSALNNIDSNASETITPIEVVNVDEDNAWTSTENNDKNWLNWNSQ
jgi:hypothetical protein